MYKEKINQAVRQLSDVMTLLVELRHRFNEFNVKPVSEELERYLDCAVAHANAPSQLNRQNQQVWSSRELKEMPYLKDLKYRRTKDGIHQFRFRRMGYDVAFNSKNYEIAKDKARAFIKDLQKKLSEGIKAKHVNTLDYVAKVWFENKKAHVAFATWQGYVSVYKNHIKPKFGNRSISRILPMDLQPFFNELFVQKGKTCENAKIILNGIFTTAVANRLCPTNPMTAVVIEKHYRTPGKTLNQEQIERFKNTMRSAGDIGTAYLIILYSGIRGAELESMTFDWANGTFTVNNAKLKKGQKVNPANLKRTVPIFPGLWELRHRIESDAWHCTPKKISNFLSKHWQETTVKDLRHTFVSKAREAGIDNELVNLWTGHLPGKNVTANIYTHFSMEKQQEEAKKLKPY